MDINKWIDEVKKLKASKFEIEITNNIKFILYENQDKKEILKSIIFDFSEVINFYPLNFIHYVFDSLIKGIRNIKIDEFLEYEKNKLNLDYSKNNFEKVLLIVKERVKNNFFINEDLIVWNPSNWNIAYKDFAWYIFYKIDEKTRQLILDILTDQKFLTCRTEYAWSRLHVGDSKYKYYIYRLSYTQFNQENAMQVFIISEFNLKNDRINKKIKNFLELKGIKTIVTNLDHKYGNIDIAIKKYIRESKWIIANLSYQKNWNPNVFYELGMAKAFDKKIVMFISSEQFPNSSNKNLPFDINSHNCLKWKKSGNLIDEISSIII